MNQDITADLINRMIFGKMAKSSPTKRSTDYLREHYPFVETVERKVPYSFISIDLFHFADLIAFGLRETVLVQTTTQPHMNERYKKITTSGEASSAARLWVLGEGRRIIIHGWKKVKGAWTLFEQEVTEGDFDFAMIPPGRSKLPPPKK